MNTLISSTSYLGNAVKISVGKAIFDHMLNCPVDALPASLEDVCWSPLSMISALPRGNVTAPNTNELKRSTLFRTVLISIVFPLAGLMVSRKNDLNQQWKTMPLFFDRH